MWADIQKVTPMYQLCARGLELVCHNLITVVQCLHSWRSGVFWYASLTVYVLTPVRYGLQTDFSQIS